jgi:uncharacterized protein YkwD
VETLDGRVLPAAGMTASLLRGVLTITGTQGSDRIAVSVSQPQGRRGAAAAVVSLNNGRQFPARSVQQIVIRGRDGNDAVSVTETAPKLIPTRIELGNGNNTVTTGAEADAIVAGNGNNVVNSGRGGDRIRYGSGRNMINGVPVGPRVTITTSGGPVNFQNGQPPPSSSVPSDPVSSLEQAIIDLVNQQRQAAGLAPLRVNQRLCAAAQIQARNMARLNEFGHVLNDTSTPTPLDRLRAVGYSYGSAGENIAYNYQGAQDVVTGWMNSPGHRANILSADYTETGVAVRYNSFNEPYYVQVFGSPM